jgi:hypothetical protein
MRSEGLTEMERETLALITEATEAGRQAPTADDIQERTGCNSISTTVNLVRRLERRGLIMVERFQRTRRITVMETGKRTADVGNETPHWRSAPRPRGVPAVAISYVQQRKPDLAREMIVAARREGLSVQDFLGELVWAGWKARAKAMASSPHAPQSPLPFTGGAGVGSRSPSRSPLVEAGSPPPTPPASGRGEE